MMEGEEEEEEAEMDGEAKRSITYQVQCIPLFYNILILNKEAKETAECFIY